MKRRFLRFFGMTLALALVGLPLVLDAKTVEELRAELQEKRDVLKTAEDKIQKFKAEIQLKKKEARTLADQIALLDENIEEVELSVVRTDAEVEEVAAEIATVDEEISQREAEIKIQKARLADYVRSMHVLDQQSTVTVFLKYQTFSDAVQEANTFGELQKRGQQTLATIQSLRTELMTKQRELEDFRQTLEALRNRQELERTTLTAQQASKDRILQLTNQQEAEYQRLLKDAQATHERSQSDISRLDALIREELEKQGIGKLPSVGTMDWPINAAFGVSCEFHCAGYPYAYLIGPHAGMDIPAYVGTPIKAPADGYVARAHDSGGPGYSYIMIIHGDKVTTVFGHVSGFAVNEGQLVTRGTVIGYTGGAPGMRGAGLSSGPHLHFEVRVNGSTVNPRGYL
jgi:murein DD-endopeptidase MepM/ murein hydrolase activator NlpD